MIELKEKANDSINTILSHERNLQSSKSLSFEIKTLYSNHKKIMDSSFIEFVNKIIKLWADKHQAEISTQEEPEKSWLLNPSQVSEGGDMTITLNDHTTAISAPENIDIVITNELGWFERFTANLDELENTLNQALKILKSEKWKKDPF